MSTDAAVQPNDGNDNSSNTPNIQTLQEAAKDVFSHTNFRNVRWADIFGSFAKATAKQKSDVDVVVIAGLELATKCAAPS